LTAHGSTSSDARAVVRTLASLNNFFLQEQAAVCTYGHIGATLADAGLQASVRYSTVVAPRVQRLIRLWPTAATLAVFRLKAARYGLSDVLRWNHPEKLARINDIAALVHADGVETEAELRLWLEQSGADARLRGVTGVGPKTADYLRRLVGLQAVPIDRHILRLLALSGVETRGYDAARSVMLSAAGLLGVEPVALDSAVWHYFSSPPFSTASCSATSCSTSAAAHGDYETARR